MTKRRVDAGPDYRARMSFMITPRRAIMVQAITISMRQSSHTASAWKMERDPHFEREKTLKKLARAAGAKEVRLGKPAEKRLCPDRSQCLSVVNTNNLHRLEHGVLTPEKHAAPYPPS
jgi:hypothetical protein